MSFLNGYCRFEITKICKILLDGMPDKSYVRLEKPFSDTGKFKRDDINMICDKGYFKFKHGMAFEFDKLKGGELAKIYQQLVRGEYKVVKVKPFERTTTVSKTKTYKNWGGVKSRVL